jgi:hypothetical protein
VRVDFCALLEQQSTPLEPIPRCGDEQLRIQTADDVGIVALYQKARSRLLGVSHKGIHESRFAEVVGLVWLLFPGIGLK